MSLLRAFGGRYFAVLPRIAADDNVNSGIVERGATKAAPSTPAAGIFSKVNANCARTYGSWRKRVSSTQSVISSLLQPQLAMLTQTAHCDENTETQLQPPMMNVHDLLIFDNLNREYKNVISQDNYDGFRLEADRQITDNIQCSHSLFLGTVMRDVGYLYQIGANYASTDGKYLAMAKIGLDGMITGRFIGKVDDNIEVKASGNSFLKYDPRNVYEAGVDYMAKNWTATAKAAWQGTWILNAAYTHQIIPKLTLGSELTYIVSNGSSIGSIAGRYVEGDHIVTIQWSKQPNFKSMEFPMQETDAGKIQYVRKINDRLSLATELEVTPITKESALRFGWDYMFRHARVQGNIDTTGRIAMQAQDFSGFGISGCIDYWHNIYRFGFMMHLLPPPPEGKAPEHEVPL
ncbi:mitochondrial import receptor subunit tom40 like protein [Babesia gibsoni]|uniref:Mitochondrial import receptor subunit tom40 like protein n=1 Tax=Babesia gibsoni TaxID=33632 RepID=A0AAD8PEV3_BABGI|nr:mitochondrial import receptor subunit tom40 like protein [Babesia gibsoni]